jgi:glycosyltransferase involved in cell wall biosynthesis
MVRIVSGTRSPGVPGRIAFWMDADAWPGGAEIWLTHLMVGLKETGWEPSLFLSDKRATDRWAEEVAARGIAVRRTRPMWIVDRAGFAQALELLRGFRIVHVNKAHPRSCLPAVRAARSAGATAVVTSEHVVLPARSRYPLGASVVRSLVAHANRAADIVTVPSESSREAYVAAYGAPRSKVVVVRPAVDPDEFGRPGDARAARAALGLPAEGRVAAIVGRLARGKGLEIAIRAVRGVRRRVPDFRLLIVGDGELAGSLARLAEQEGVVDAVVFAGSKTDVPGVLAAVDLLVVASESETAGMSAIEAMAAGLPVVATDVGGIPEAVIGGATGVLVPPGRTDALATAISDVLTSDDAGAALGVAGRERVASAFTRERLVETMSGIYKGLVGRGGGRG